MIKKILIVEDEPDIRELLSIHVKDLPAEVVKTDSGNQGLNYASTHVFDAIILDIMLPDVSGIDILKTLRAQNNQTPILMLTAKSEELDIILGLELGADDYLTKPFSIKELIARIKALLRRAEKQQDAQHTERSFEELSIDYKKCLVELASERIALTAKEYELLKLLSQHPGRSFSRKELLNKVWAYDFGGYEHTVNSHINRLRNKIEPDPENPKFILTAWGIGYRFNDQLVIA